MNRRHFLKAAVSASTLPLVPGVAFAAGSEAVFHIPTFCSGFTKDKKPEVISGELVAQVADMTWGALERSFGGRLPVWRDYDRFRPPIGWLVGLESNASRPMQPLYDKNGEVFDYIPGKLNMTLLATVRSREDLTGLHLGPTLHWPSAGGLELGAWGLFEKAVFAVPHGARKVAG